MRRLQKGHDAEDAVIARPKRTGFSPIEEDVRGRGSTTPPTGENDAHGHRRHQDFRPNVPPPPLPNETPDLDDPVASHHRRRSRVTPQLDFKDSSIV